MTAVANRVVREYPPLPMVKIGARESMRFEAGGYFAHVDWERQIFFLQVSPLHSRKALESTFLFLEAIGLELMDEMECPAELLPCGAVRYWFAEVVSDVPPPVIWSLFDTPPNE